MEAERDWRQLFWACNFGLLCIATGCSDDSPAIGRNTSSGKTPIAAPSERFVPDERWPDCVHPAVKEDCADGWCRVPAGCFVFGSPESEPARAFADELQGPTTLTHDFEIQQTETTWKQWLQQGFAIPENMDDECLDEDCPQRRPSLRSAGPIRVASERCAAYRSRQPGASQLRPPTPG